MKGNFGIINLIISDIGDDHYQVPTIWREIQPSNQIHTSTFHHSCGKKHFYSAYSFQEMPTGQIIQRTQYNDKRDDFRSCRTPFSSSLKKLQGISNFQSQAGGHRNCRLKITSLCQELFCGQVALTGGNLYYQSLLVLVMSPL